MCHCRACAESMDTVPSRQCRTYGMACGTGESQGGFLLCLRMFMIMKRANRVMSRMAGGGRTYLQDPVLVRHPLSEGGVTSTARELAALPPPAAAGDAPSASSPRTWQCYRCVRSWTCYHHPSPAQHTPGHHVCLLLLLKKIVHKLYIIHPCKAPA